ncbi:hypothetical protein PVAG01_01838 [Phlyctema vagabunda]|uniref:Uncharacterized protein n=1 Tax=Phlyctema vagabunda TaxID=108571 RepID=A0ABR4PY61_9HELO
MPSIQTVRRNNAQLRTKASGLVAVFVGGTSGIGEATCTEFVQKTVNPVVYIIGRNESYGSSMSERLLLVNSTARIHFLPSDLSLLRNVDGVCRLIKEKERKINLLFITAGFLSLKGRDETAEGLDKLFCLQYHSRMRFTSNLLPLLNQALGKGELARVISVLGAGNEGKIFKEDLSLRENYSLQNCSGQSICMMSLFLERLALLNPGVSFIHAYPGAVRGTDILKEMGPLVAKVGRVMMLLASPFTVSVKECAERQLFVATHDSFQSLTSQTEPDSAPTQAKSFRLGWNGEVCKKNAYLDTYMRDGTDEIVWKHTSEVFENICGDKSGI